MAQVIVPLVKIIIKSVAKLKVPGTKCRAKAARTPKGLPDSRLHSHAEDKIENSKFEFVKEMNYRYRS